MLSTRWTPHNHRCPECDTVWHHDPDTIEHSERKHLIAHTCPLCGTEQFTIDKKGGKPEFCSNGSRCIRIGSGEQIIPKLVKLLPVFNHFRQSTS